MNGSITSGIHSERLLERFLRYVRIDSMANPSSATYPSSPGQLAMGRLIVDELRNVGLEDAEQDGFGLVYATIPPTASKDLPVVAFNAHLDTSPETTASGVEPQVIRDYRGGDIPLPGDPSRVIRVTENPELEALHGATLITTDGRTLLGGDDKAGVAVIVELAAHLMEHPEIPHGPVRVLFTCDEEIGRGVDYVDLKRLGADVAYTLDGGGENEIDTETFSADLAVVRFEGVNIHPSIAKDRMVNAIRAAGEFVARLPRDRMAPEVTTGRDGFVHPYDMTGGVAEVTLRILLRDFESAALDAQAALLRTIAADVERLIPGVKVCVAVRPQYRNLGEGLTREPRAVDYAEEAHRRLGRVARRTVVRGGTDGSQFTARGLPTPNLSTGQHNPHSPLEWACLDQMRRACEVCVELVRIWAGDP